MSDSFRIAFSGGILPGFTLDLVRRQVRERLKATPEQLVRMFSGRPLFLKKDLNEAAALEYLRRLQNLGLDVTLEAAINYSARPQITEPAAQTVTPSSTETSSPPSAAAPATSSRPQAWLSDTGFADFARTHLNLSRAEALLNGNFTEAAAPEPEISPPMPAAPAAKPLATAVSARTLLHSPAAEPPSAQPESRSNPASASLQLSGQVLCPHCSKLHPIHAELLQTEFAQHASPARLAG